ncbi:MAG: alpha/beta hydrolase [Bacteroidales bacterium]|nr:alpha/beta hydrolase [Bacteroidales bacterium]
MKKLILITFALLQIFSVFAQKTYSFAMRDTLGLKLDVYQPANPRPDHACVVYVFGGGFFSGERDNEYSKKCCQLLSDRGFVAVAIDYRLYLKHAPKLPLLKMYRNFETAISQAVQDCSDAVRYLCDHATELKIDTSRIILTGSSAGAITVLQTDYCRANSLPDAASLPQGFRPAAVIPYAGAILCHNRDLRYAQPPAPTCFFHGTSDRIVNYRRFRASLSESLFGADKVSRLFQKEGYSHWMMRFDKRGHEVAIALPPTIDEFCAFVDAALSGRVMSYDAHCTDAAVKVCEWTNMTLFDLYLK